ncbi:MAG: hypothetical protein ACJ767_01585 [Chloroflexota bacterium]
MGDGEAEEAGLGAALLEHATSDRHMAVAASATARRVTTVEFIAAETTLRRDRFQNG